MARPQKSGLDYFPLDVNLDDKIELMETECGIEGFGIFIRILQNIYKNSYYIDWNDDIKLLFCRKNAVSVSTLDKVIDICLKRGLFENSLFVKHKILTSRGIQKRFLAAISTCKRKNVIFFQEYFLINPEETPINSELIIVNSRVTPEETPINSELIGKNSEFSTQRKEKKNKEYKNIEEEYKSKKEERKEEDDDFPF